MPEKCDKTFSTKEFSDLKAAISPFVKTRYTRVKNDIGPGTHDGAVDAILPCGIAQQETTIEPRLRKNHSHARAHPAHAQKGISRTLVFGTLGTKENDETTCSRRDFSCHYN